MNVSEAIASLRKTHNMSQQELADSLFVSRSLVAMWESGRRLPDGVSIERMARIFGVPEEEIAGDPGLAYLLPPERELILNEIGEFAADGETKTHTDGETKTQTGNGKTLLKNFLAGLGKRDRELFMNRYYLMKTCKSIAAEMKMNESTVRGRLARIRTKLKRYIERNEKNDT